MSVLGGVSQRPEESRTFDLPTMRASLASFISFDAGLTFRPEHCTVAGVVTVRLAFMLRVKSMKTRQHIEKN